MARRRACDSCYKKKIQCDGDLPNCNWCKHHDIRCTFDRPHRVKRTIKAHYAPQESLAKRIERIELALGVNRRTLASSIQDFYQSSGASTPNSSDPTSSGSSVPSGWASGSQPQSAGMDHLHFAGRFVGNMNSFNGIPFFSRAGRDWVRSRTGEEPSFEKLYALGPPWQTRLQAEDPFPIPELLTHATDQALPDRKTVEQFVSEYCSSAFGNAFPIIDKVIFQDTIDAAYTEPEPLQSFKPASAKACLFSFLSLASMCQAEWETLPSLDGEVFAAATLKLLPQALLETQVTAPQTTCMLTLYNLLHGHMHQGKLLHSLTCSLLLALGAHLHLKPSHHNGNGPHGDEKVVRLRRNLRRLFWLTYSLDKEIALRTGLPPSIDDEFCDLGLSEEDEWFNDEPHQGGSPSSLVSGQQPSSIRVPGGIRLTLLKSKICKSLYSWSALQKNDADLLREIRELDDELEQWRLSIPASGRPSLGVLDEQHTQALLEACSRVQMQQHFTQFDYHYLVAAVHRASGRCRGWIGDQASDLQGISSSIAMSVQASRATLTHLRAVGKAFVEEVFWVIVFYPLSAILTLFCNILLCPLDPQAPDDLRLICSVPQLVKDLRTRRLKRSDEVYLRDVHEFSTELARLGSCAIAKAKGG